MLPKRKETTNKKLFTTNDIRSLIGKEFTCEGLRIIYTIEHEMKSRRLKITWKSTRGKSGSYYSIEDIIKYINKGVWTLLDTKDN